MIYDVIVIGAGTAGMTAALNALRNGKTVLVLEKETVGASSPRRRAIRYVVLSVPCSIGNKIVFIISQVLHSPFSRTLSCVL